MASGCVHFGNAQFMQRFANELCVRPLRKNARPQRGHCHDSTKCTALTHAAPLMTTNNAVTVVDQIVPALSAHGTSNSDSRTQRLRLRYSFQGFGVLSLFINCRC